MSFIHVLCNISYYRSVKTWTVVGRPHLVRSPHLYLSPRFMSSPKCLVHVLYLVSSTQFAVCSPQCLFNTDRVNRYQSCLFRVYARRRAFINKTRTIILFANTSFLRLAFGIIATGHFHFRNNETQDMLLYQSNPVGVKLFSYLNTLVGFMLHNFCTEIQASEVKLQISSFDLFNRKKCKFWSKRRG